MGQRVAFKMFLGNAWNPPCRSSLCFCGIIRLYNSVTTPREQDLFSPRSFNQSTQSTGRFLVKISSSGRQGILLPQTVKWTTELQTWAHPSLEAQPPQLYCRHFFIISSSIRAAIFQTTGSGSLCSFAMRFQRCSHSTMCDMSASMSFTGFGCMASRCILRTLANVLRL